MQIVIQTKLKLSVTVFNFGCVHNDADAFKGGSRIFRKGGTTENVTEYRA